MRETFNQTDARVKEVRREDKAMARRIALLLPLAACLCASCEGPAAREERAANTIFALGGRVQLDTDHPGLPVIGVDLWGTAVRDAAVKDLQRALPAVKITGPR